MQIRPLITLWVLFSALFPLAAQGQDKQAGAFTPQPIPEAEQEKLEAYKLCIKQPAPKESALACAFEAGRIYYQYKHLDEALSLFQDIVEDHPADPLAATAAPLLLDILILQKKYEKLGVYVKKLRDDPLLSKDPKLSPILDLLYLQILARECQKQEQDERWSEAGQCYASLVDEIPDLPAREREEALFNAAVSFEKAGQLGYAIQYLTLLTQQPDAQTGPNALFALGRLYTRLAMYKEAAARFEEFGNKFPGEKDAATALDRAALFREALGEYDDAVENRKKFIVVASRKMMAKDEYAHAFYQIAQIRERQTEKSATPKEAKKNSRATFEVYEAYTRYHGKDGSPDDLLMAKTRAAAYLWNLGKKEEAFERCREVVKIAERLGEKAKDLSLGLEAAAECAFYLAEKEYEAFTRLKLPADFDAKKLREWFGEMKKTREEVSALYLKVKDYGSKDWTLAAFARIGMISYKFMDGLYNAPLPEVVTVPGYGKVRLKGALKKEIEEKVRESLVEIAEPIRADAIATFSVCLQGAVQSRWYNEWSSLCEEHLNKLAPDSYPLLAEWTAEPLYEAPVVVYPSILRASGEKPATSELFSPSLPPPAGF